MDLTWESQWERSGAIFISPQKGRGHLKHDFRLTERLLPDSTMTYRDRSDGLVVESDRKKSITFKFTCHLRDLQGYCVYKSGVFFFSFFPFPLGSASPQSPLWTSRPCRLHCGRQESLPKEHQHSTKHHWLLTALPGNHCQLNILMMTAFETAYH